MLPRSKGDTLTAKGTYVEQDMGSVVADEVMALELPDFRSLWGELINNSGFRWISGDSLWSSTLN